MSFDEAINKYKKYKRLSKIDAGHIHVHNYKMDKYATILQKGGYDVSRLDKIDTVVTKIDNIMNTVQNGGSRIVNQHQSNSLSGGANKGHAVFSNANTSTMSNNSNKKNVVKIGGLDKVQSTKSAVDKYNASIDVIFRELRL